MAVSGDAPMRLGPPEGDKYSRSPFGRLLSKEKGGIMSVWQLVAWAALATLTVLRVALVVGIIAIVVAIVRGVRAYDPAAHTT